MKTILYHAPLIIVKRISAIDELCYEIAKHRNGVKLWLFTVYREKQFVDSLANGNQNSGLIIYHLPYQERLGRFRPDLNSKMALINCKWKHIFLSISRLESFQDVPFIWEIFWSVKPNLSCIYILTENFGNFG